MDNFITVSVSPFYNGRGWTDAATGIDFEKTDSIRQIRIAKNKDLRGIQNSIRLNNLLLLEGTLENSSKELNIDSINPEELTKEQFAVLAEKLKAGQADPEIEQKLAAVKAEVKESKKALDKKDTDLKEVEQKLAEVKTAFYTKYAFDAKEAGDYTVEDLKEILDAKEIKYAAGDKKTALIKKLTVPAK